MCVPIRALEGIKRDACSTKGDGWKWSSQRADGPTEHSGICRIRATVDAVRLTSAIRGNSERFGRVRSSPVVRSFDR